MRKTIIQTKPHIILLLSCLVIALVAWLRRDYSVDLQLYDTYYVISIALVAEFLITIILITSILYWLTRHRTGFPQLTAAHVLGTIGIALYLVSTSGTPPNNAIETWSPMSFQQYQSWEDLSLRFAVAMLTFASFQMLLLVNLVVKWIKG